MFHTEQEESGEAYEFEVEETASLVSENMKPQYSKSKGDMYKRKSCEAVSADVSKKLRTAKSIESFPDTQEFDDGLEDADVNNESRDQRDGF